ncbi:uncharacterized protein TNCV_3412971 [Trichonephila clavipes]|uniref:Uncharacterized protein n=1 Tax=Trichonephila clavipes TaxID=2585209 RepID=A0A8X6RJY0_TRICX|nr:uncharacterized protein TNCV_3412971 [Trichonephila clavipes]
MADVQDLKSALLYALKLEAANKANCKDRHSIRGTRVNAAVPCESPWIKKIQKLREEIQDLMVQRQNLRRRRIPCWGCNGAAHLRSSCPRINKEDRNKCNRVKESPRKRTRGRLQLYNVVAPFERIDFDILGPLPRPSDGNNNILVVMDYFTKWPEAYPISDQEASTVAEV